jgi:hypothetical protein
MIVDAQLDQEEIQNWLNMAVLYAHSIPDDIDRSLRDTAFSLIEDLYTTAEVEVMTGASLSDIDLNEVGEGYDYDKAYFKPIILLAYEFLLINGLELSGVLDNKNF